MLKVIEQIDGKQVAINTDHIVQAEIDAGEIGGKVVKTINIRMINGFGYVAKRYPYDSLIDFAGAMNK